MTPLQNRTYLHCLSIHENRAKLGAEMKNSDPNHPKAPFMVYYPPFVVPKAVGGMTFKLLSSLWYPVKLEGSGGACVLAETMIFNRRVVGSTPSSSGMKAVWSSNKRISQAWQKAVVRLLCGRRPYVYIVWRKTICSKTICSKTI